MMRSTEEIGFQILQSINGADAFNCWMYETIKPYLHGDVLEIGSGIGNISQFVLKDNFHLSLSDISSTYLEHLQASFKNQNNTKEFLSVDLSESNFFDTYGSLRNKYDCILLLNVLEHIKDDERAVENCHFLLKENGTLIVLVPAYRVLYSTLDKTLGHYKRYTARTLLTKFSKRLFSIETSFYFNCLGIAAWFYAKVFSLETISIKSMKKYNKLVKIAKILDRLLRRKIGLSVIVVATKKKYD
jgi:SAM-dependent methyltransferase